MLKLMKYEFRKQLWSKGIILFLAAILEIAFIVGILGNKENWQVIAIGFLSMLAFGAIFFVGIECIDTFSKDLKTKCSYMLFLTPNTSFSIVGAKILAGGIQIILTGLVFFGVFLLNGTMLVIRYNGWKDIFRVAREIVNSLFKIEMDLKFMTLILLSLLISWLYFIILAFFSITLSTTFLANKRYKGFVSITVFVLISWVVSYVQSKFIGYHGFTEKDMWLSLIYMFIISVVTYVGTAWMLEKKVSV